MENAVFGLESALRKSFSLYKIEVHQRLTLPYNCHQRITQFITMATGQPIQIIRAEDGADEDSQKASFALEKEALAGACLSVSLSAYQ